MNKKWKMHFCKGKPCSWQGDVYDEERDADETYELDISYATYSRGCSSAKLIYVPTDKLKNYEETYTDGTIYVYVGSSELQYNVFLSDFGDIARRSVNGRIKGTFRFVKKGKDYGIQLVNDMNENGK